MIHFFKAALTIVTAICAAAVMHCSEKVAGAGSETTNGIVGAVLNICNVPAPNAIVKLFPDTYDPVTDSGHSYPLIDTTDREGVFRFEHIDTGKYSILARDENIAAGLLIRRVVVSRSDSITFLSPASLSANGSIIADFSGSPEPASGYIYLPGTDIFSFIDSNGVAVLADVPSGSINSVIHASENGIRRNILHSELIVPPESSVTIYAAWKFSRRIILYTRVEGADVADDLYGFPVLIRLNSFNFNFAEADPEGDDLLFAGSDGSPLPFEIERWDARGERAEIWVRINNISADADSQAISMYWGNPDAIRHSSGEAVFDTTFGFTGVWHMADTVRDSARDATVNHYHAVSVTPSSPQIGTGIIGNCRQFNGTDNFLTVPGSAGSRLNFPQNGRFSVSAWVYVESADNHSHVIVSKGNMQYFLWHTAIHLNTTLWEFADYRNKSGWDLSVSPVTTGQWVLLTGVRDSTTQHLYVNGELLDTLIDYPFGTERNSTFDLMIGRFAQIMASPNNDEGYCYFNGGIDELRIYSRALSAAWIRLCYMNQRSDDRVVEFKF